MELAEITHASENDVRIMLSQVKVALQLLGGSKGVNALMEPGLRIIEAIEQLNAYKLIDTNNVIGKLN